MQGMSARVRPSFACCPATPARAMPTTALLLAAALMTFVPHVLALDRGASHVHVRARQVFGSYYSSGRALASEGLPLIACEERLLDVKVTAGGALTWTSGVATFDWPAWGESTVSCTALRLGLRLLASTGAYLCEGLLKAYCRVSILWDCFFLFRIDIEPLKYWPGCQSKRAGRRLSSTGLIASRHRVRQRARVLNSSVLTSKLQGKNTSSCTRQPWREMS